MAVRKTVGRSSPHGTVLVKGTPKLPTNTPGRARAALARINQATGLSPAQKVEVVRAAYARLGTPPAQRKVAVSSAGRITKKK